MGNAHKMIQYFLLIVSLTQVLFGYYSVEGIYEISHNCSGNIEINDDLFNNFIFMEAREPLDIPTYDGSGQLTHPSVIYFPSAWNGHKYWAVATPYPYGDDRYENPSIYCFDEPGENWIVPTGCINPVVCEPLEGFNSDPCIEYNNISDELYIIYRDYNYKNWTINYLLIRSSDGIRWSEPISVYYIKGNVPTCTNHMPLYRRIYYDLYVYLYNMIHHENRQGATNYERSNAFIQLPNGTWMMWAQQWDSSYSIIYRTSSDCFIWSEPKDCIFADRIYDKDVWHIDVKYIPEYHQFYMIQYSMADKSLRLAKSENGIEWKSNQNRLLGPSTNESNFANKQLYKSSMTYDPLDNMVHLWYSGVNTEIEWRIGYTNATYSTFDDFV